MNAKTIIGIIFVVASLMVLSCLWNFIHWSWLQRVSEEPWASYVSPTGLMIVGVSLIYDEMKRKQEQL